MSTHGSPKYLSTKDLAERWVMADETLRRWRSEGRGPAFIKIEGVVRYLLSDIEKIEKQNTTKKETN